MEEIKNPREYVYKLETYFDQMESVHPNYKDEQLRDLAMSIKAYKMLKRNRQFWTVAVKTLTFIALTSLLLGFATIWAINEVLNHEIDFSIKNAAVIELVFIIARFKLRFRQSEIMN